MWLNDCGTRQDRNLCPHPRAFYSQESSHRGLNSTNMKCCNIHPFLWCRYQTMDTFDDACNTVIQWDRLPNFTLHGHKNSNVCWTGQCIDFCHKFLHHFISASELFFLFTKCITGEVYPYTAYCHCKGKCHVLCLRSQAFSQTFWMFLWRWLTLIFTFLFFVSCLLDKLNT